MSYLNLASVRTCTESEGPGRRFALWVQGCERRCPGCCNPEMQPIRRNTIVDVQDLIKLIARAQSEESIEGVSLIGGEPVLQAEGVADLAQWCHDHGLSVLLFTGYLYDDLLRMNDLFVNRLLSATDLLVDGPFIVSEYDEERDWIGSKNQKLWFLSDRYMPGIEYEHGARSMEVLISDRNILINGWPFLFEEEP